jgi:hypothetical protein
MPVLLTPSEQNTASALRLLFLFNLLDAFLSVLWINSGVAIEANPIMAAAMSHGMSFFVLVKISMVSMAIAILWHTRKNRLSRYASLAATLAMGLVVIYHVYGIFDAAYL